MLDLWDPLCKYLFQQEATRLWTWVHRWQAVLQGVVTGVAEHHEISMAAVALGDPCILWVAEGSIEATSTLMHQKTNVVSLIMAIYKLNVIAMFLVFMSSSCDVWQLLCSRPNFLQFEWSRQLPQSTTLTVLYQYIYCVFHTDPVLRLQLLVGFAFQ